MMKKSVSLGCPKKILLMPFLALVFHAGLAHAVDLENAYLLALQNDPQFQASKSERQATKAQAYQNWSAYIPTANISQQQYATDVTSRRVATFNVPLFDAEKAAQVAQGNSRNQYAEQNFRVKMQDLAQRLLKAVNQLILTGEALRANRGRVVALEGQFKAAQRKYEGGLGTVTDLRDIEVKFNMAKADDLTLAVQKKIAARQLAMITGIAPNEAEFILPNSHADHPLPSMDSVLSRVRESNPTIMTAREQESIAKYDIARASGQVLPTVSYTHLRTEYQNTITWNDGVTVMIPIQTGSYINTYGMAKKYSQASSQREDAEAKTQLDAERYYSLSETGLLAVKIKRSAVDSAQLSVEANQKSFTAGVRSTTDVLNSIQVLFQTKNEYAQAVAAQAESYLNLLLVQNEDPALAMRQTQTFLFRK